MLWKSIILTCPQVPKPWVMMDLIPVTGWLRFIQVMQIEHMLVNILHSLRPMFSNCSPRWAFNMYHFVWSWPWTLFISVYAASKYIILFTVSMSTVLSTTATPMTSNVKRYLLNYPHLSDYGQTIFCLSFPSRDRATAPGQYEQFYFTEHVPYPQK